MNWKSCVCYLYVILFFLSGFLLMAFQSFISEASVVTKKVSEDQNEGIRFIDIHGVKTAFYDYQPSLSTRNTVILLHGMRYSKETWKKLTTLYKLKAAGYRAIALDLPSYGETSGKLTIPKLGFLEMFIAKLNVGNPVLISPSMSGTFAIPYVFEFTSKLSGWVPVSPVSLSSHNKEEYASLNLPVLAVYGENDRQFKNEVEKYLGAIPGVTLTKIPDASHPCYLDKPELWHSLILHFLDHIS